MDRKKIMEKNYITSYMLTIFSYDKETYEHSLKVAKITELMLDAYPEKIEPDLRQEIIMGAYLHDIGKTLVPIEIIRKKEPLSKLDFAYIKQHPLYGIQMIKEDKLGAIVENIILKHHEKLDGSGYPCGYDREEIEDMVRIVSVADVYSALTEPRQYKRALNQRDSMFILNNLVEKGEMDATALCALKQALEIKKNVL